MVCLAIDTSTTSTGWCIRDIDEDKIVDFGLIKPISKLNVTQRIIYIEQQLKSIWHEYEPAYIIMEEMSVCRNMQTMRKLIGLIEHLEIEFTKLDALVVRVTPSQWRKDKIKGANRNELKQAGMKYVKEKYGIKVNDDVSDAIIISEYHIELEG